MSENRWDAQSYAHNARFVSDLGMPVVEWLNPQEAESILDLGCGDGALTAKLAAMGVDITGIDHSQSMVDAAGKLGLSVLRADMHNFALERHFDAVFTNAVLHWTRDIDAVVACVALHLKSDSRFVGEFGGFGNVAAVVTAMRAAIQLEGAEDGGFSWYYPSPNEFRAVLARHGFEAIRVELIPRPTHAPTGMLGWLNTFGVPFVAHLDAKTQQRIIARAVELLSGSLRDHEGNWTVDYVRLRFHAVLGTGEQA